MKRVARISQGPNDHSSSKEENTIEDLLLVRPLRSGCEAIRHSARAASLAKVMKIVSEQRITMQEVSPRANAQGEQVKGCWLVKGGGVSKDTKRRSAT